MLLSSVNSAVELRGLAERIRRGDASAETELVCKFTQRIFVMAVVRTRDRETARELVQDVLVAVIAALHNDFEAHRSHHCEEAVAVHDMKPFAQVDQMHRRLESNGTPGKPFQLERAAKDEDQTSDTHPNHAAGDWPGGRARIVDCWSQRHLIIRFSLRFAFECAHLF